MNPLRKSTSQTLVILILLFTLSLLGVVLVKNHHGDSKVSSLAVIGFIN